SARLVETLARAVEHAHRHGVVHRDLKPANVLLASHPDQDAPESGEDRPLLAGLVPKIADFGLAKRLDVQTGQTRSGTIVGTPAYMAPEQASGKVHNIGPAADVYALGAILYELLTGKPPFQAPSSLEIVLKVISDRPVSPRQVRPWLHKDLET